MCSQTQKHLYPLFTHKKNKSLESSGPKWQPQRMLNTPPPTDTPNLQLHMKESSLKEFPLMIPAHWVNKKKPTWKWVGKAETQACHKPHSWHSNVQLRRNPQFPVSPWGVKDLDPTSSIPIFKTSASRTWSPKHLALIASRACIHKTQKMTANKQFLTDCRGFIVAIALRLSTGGNRKKKCPPPNLSLKIVCSFMLKAAAWRWGF